MAGEKPWRLAAALALGAGLAYPALAVKHKLEISDLTADPPISGTAITGLAWLPDSRSFSYIVRRGAGEEATQELWIEDVSPAKKRVAIPASTLAITSEPAPKASAGSSEPKRVPLDGYHWSPDARSVLLSGAHDLWLYRLEGQGLVRLTHSEEDEEFPTFSPDGRRIAYVRGHDLFVLDVATGHESRLTSDGSEKVFNGRLDWVYEEELADRSGRAFEWSPDGSMIAYLRLDDAPIVPYPITDFLALPAAVDWQAFPRAGEKNPLVSFCVVGLDGKARGEARSAGDGYIEPSFSWTMDSKSVSYRLLNRAQTRREVRLETLPGGSSRALFVEEDPYWINADGAESPRFLPDGRFIWKSEKTGFAHLCVGDVAGKSPAEITNGRWMIDSIAGVDPRAGWIYFTATEENVRRRPIYRVRLDGREFSKLTSNPATHSAKLSPDGRFLLDTFSTASEPPAVALREASGRALRTVDQPVNRLSEFELGKIEEHTVTASDGQTLMASLLKPPFFDPSRKYPVIVSVYGGPHAQVVRDAWGAVSLLDQLLANRGYIVWSLDNRGSWGRGHAWESAIFRETGKHELADQLSGVQYLKSLPFVDPTRIGIWGWSYGGYMTLYALTRAPEVWKCGVAGAPVTDWKFYDTIYTERYMRTPSENPKGYEASAPLSEASRLKAKLLILHGLSDDNVHFQNSVAFVEALTQAGRPYQLQIQPRERHGFHGKAALDFRNAAIVKFFENNL